MIERFVHPLFLLLLLLLPLALVWRWRIRPVESLRLRISDTRIHRRIAGQGRARLRRLPRVLRMLVMVLLVFAIARPQSGTHEQEILSEGVDIILALDLSTSMRGEDFRPKNRLEEAREQARAFVRKRPQDRIGLVIFAHDAYTQCPLTLDHDLLDEFLLELEMGLIEDGTAIGSAIATAANRLRESEAESRVLVLLTDGDNNAGKIDPLSASKAAAALGIRIYTIGMGKEGKVPYPVDDPFFGRRYQYMETNLDEETLREVARLGKGQYFRADREGSLAEIYAEIDELEKSEIESIERVDYREAGLLFLLPALLFFLLEILFSRWILRGLP
ncbi:MAG: VWA domain-containing protein [Candidatus Krumholzibacteria bacterium]|jgi:Ca-activated chloride channel family protein|nr:VWA domain-containing protein [Candidatus Krumholzibacteria bacterium]MDP6668459.1 VWA domain-containing protein [Candidatus Krumholzibacteria bacterium]MDP7021552.1 VWA domain-containing protein [Candidatus Krumholzibacteria bacterium]